MASASEPLKWGFPKIRGTLLGVQIIRIIVFWGLYWGHLMLGNYQPLKWTVNWQGLLLGQLPPWAIRP